MIDDSWRATAHAQAGLLTRAQLGTFGVRRWAIAHRVTRGEWLQLTPTVVSTTSGEPSRLQLLWLAVLAAGEGAAIGELTAAQEWGLRRWERPEVVVVISHDRQPPAPVPGVTVRRSRRDLRSQTRRRRGLPLIRIEPAVLTWAARQRSSRTAEGVLAATVQQGLASPEGLTEWVDRLDRLRGAPRFRRVLEEISGGAQSVGELDVRRLCRRFGLALPARQVRRRDAHGRLRFTDCEWHLPGGRTLVLEVDGGFHMEVEHWEDDLARQRALAAPDRLIVRGTTRELRDEPERLAADLMALGVPRTDCG
ncbi:MAG: endonuclease domain-containing protein [Nocardioidaceae bacterium]|nr:endonuclease domain-containing protein [Nocardioidaceae bacterium]MCL2613321.1 endonuclease domain-containing protein [Nocardioidaceae bacterium]